MGWCAMSQMIVVHISVDRWSGTDLSSSLIGAWSTADGGPDPIDPHEALDTVRGALGARWTPASVEQISAWHSAFASSPDVPWEQISLF